MSVSIVNKPLLDRDEDEEEVTLPPKPQVVSEKKTTTIVKKDLNTTTVIINDNPEPKWTQKKVEVGMVTENQRISYKLKLCGVILAISILITTIVVMMVFLKLKF